jgi:hypothetical protein
MRATEPARTPKNIRGVSQIRFGVVCRAFGSGWAGVGCLARLFVGLVWLCRVGVRRVRRAFVACVVFP